MTEILAPAGGYEQLIAAVRAGADAVYLGLKSFSARAGAENFDEYGLKNAVSYCHARNVRVHVALNTLVADDELNFAAKQVELAALAGADAIIVQDLAVAKLAKLICPDMSLHASTQMTVYNSFGAAAAADLGFSRVVLARESELSEIESITKNSRIETEVFIHGALCMCISGACYLSSMIGGRSGNRGRCAQPCRLDFKLGQKPYALSLKDMSHIGKINELAKAGVSSFKIEGRMKRPEYVACAVNAVRDALEGRTPDMKTLEEVFSRSGFTNGYITGKRTADMFGVRTEEDVKKSAAALGKVRELYRRERQSIGINASLVLDENTAHLTLDDGSDTAYVCSQAVEPAVSRPLDAETAKKCISKLGDTPFYLGEFYFETIGNVTVRSSDLNSLRRMAAEDLIKKREKSAVHRINSTDIVLDPSPCEQGADIRIRVSKSDQIPENFNGELVIPMNVLIKEPLLIEKYADRILCEIDPVFFEKDAEDVRKKLYLLKEKGIRKTVAENIGAVYLSLKNGLETHGGFGLNIFNSYALKEYEIMGLKSALLSFELSSERISSLSGMKKGIAVYGYLPLMRMRACPAKSARGCKNCSGLNTLTDRKNVSFNLLCSEKKYSTLLNSVPLYVGDKNFKNIGFKLIYLTVETPEQSQCIYDAVLNSDKFYAERTAGLYFRHIE